MARNNVIRMNTLHLNSVRLNGIGEVQSVSLSAGNDPEQPPVTPQTYTLAASVNNGVVTATRNGVAVALPYVANEGDIIVLSVTPNDGYAFEGWNDGNTDNPRTITMTADVALSAQCVEVVQPPVGNYIQFEDKAVEAICVANWSSDGIGLTEEDAAKVTTIGTTFKGNTEITSFDEFRYFTGVTSLVASAFEGCTSLTSLPIGRMRSIGSKALSNCTSLYIEELDLPYLADIGSSALNGVRVKHIVNLGTISTLPSSHYFNGLGIDANLLESAAIPSSVAVIPNYFFYNCKSLSSLSIDWSKITHIGAGSFHNCSALVIEEMNASLLQSIGVTAFVGATIKRVTNLGVVTSLPNGNYANTFGSVSGELIEVILPNTLTSLPNFFVYRSNIPSIEIPDSVTQINVNAFNGCSKLAKIVCRATTPPSLGSNALQNTSSSLVIYVPDASLEAYKTAVNWSAYADRIHPLSEIEDYYVSDALLMHLDGINKGNVEGEWQDLVSGNTFVNHGAIAEADGWRFDGDSSYMDSTTVTNYGPGYSDITIEAVVEFERENTTEIVYMGSSGGYSFGRYTGERCIILQSGGYELGFPSLADDMKKGVRVVSVSASNFQIVASKINGNDGQVSSSNLFSGSISAILLGKRAPGNHFKGKIHAVRIHNRILTEEEILYNQRLDNKRFNLGLDI